MKKIRAKTGKGAGAWGGGGSKFELDGASLAWLRAPLAIYRGGTQSCLCFYLFCFVFCAAIYIYATLFVVRGAMMASSRTQLEQCFPSSPKARGQTQRSIFLLPSFSGSISSSFSSSVTRPASADLSVGWSGGWSLFACRKEQRHRCGVETRCENAGGGGRGNVFRSFIAREWFAVFCCFLLRGGGGVREGGGGRGEGGDRVIVGRSRPRERDVFLSLALSFFSCFFLSRFRLFFSFLLLIFISAGRPARRKIIGGIGDMGGTTLQNY